MSNTNYNPVDIIQNRNKLRESEKLVFFSGAGISVESPSSNPLSKDIINSLIDLFCDIAFNSTKEKKIYKGKIQNDDIRMEYIFDILEDIFDKKVLTFFEYSKDGYPNLDHLVFAKLCKQRGNQKKTTDIFTLNFDLLHENSLKQLKLRPNSLNNSADFKNFLISKKHHKYNIYHLHGSINNPNEISVNLFDIALSLQKEREKIFIEKIKDRDVFCFGYSDDDPDTFSILKKYSRHIFWYVYDEDDIPQSVKDYRSNSHNKVIFIYRHFGENFPDPKESFFYQSIVNIFNLKIDEKKFSEKYNINIGNTENEIKLKLNDYCNNLKKVFFNYPQNSKGWCNIISVK